MRTEKIGTTLEALLETLGLADVKRSALIFSRWADIAGDALEKTVEPEQFRKGVLHLSVSNHAWAQELHFLKPTFIEKINSMLGENIVTDIRFRVKGR